MAAAFWSIYIVKTARGSLYTGISPDVRARIATHNSGKGARSLRGALPVQLVYQCALGERGLAQRVEYQIKKLTAADKRRLINQHPEPGKLLELLGLES